MGWKPALANDPDETYVALWQVARDLALKTKYVRDMAKEHGFEVVSIAKRAGLYNIRMRAFTSAEYERFIEWYKSRPKAGARLAMVDETRRQRAATRS